MSGPDFEGVIAAHREDATYPDTCLCESEAFPEGPSGRHYAAHLSAALHVELARWLAEQHVERKDCVCPPEWIATGGECMRSMTAEHSSEEGGEGLTRTDSNDDRSSSGEQQGGDIDRQYRTGETA